MFPQKENTIWHFFYPQFQPRLDPELSRQLDAELAKSGLLPGGAEGAPGGVEEVADVLGSGDSAGVFAACQCHACLKQSGHMISTSLPLQVCTAGDCSNTYIDSYDI